MRQDTIRVGSANAPRRSPKKPFVGSPRHQAANIARVMERGKLHVIGVAESYASQRLALRTMNWGVFAAKPNQGGPGNALVNRKSPRDRRVRRSRTRNVRVRYHRYKGGLNMAMATYKRGQFSLTVVSLHLPIRSDASQAEWDAQLRGVLSQIPSGPVCIVGDFNRDRDTVQQALGAAWRHAATSEVMHVFHRGCKEVASGVVIQGYHKVVSDHLALPWVELGPKDR